LDASGGSVFLNLFGAAKDVLIRAAASTQTLCHVLILLYSSGLCVGWVHAHLFQVIMIAEVRDEHESEGDKLR